MKSFYFSKFNFLIENLNQEQKVAIVPGSFKPPHKGHYAMIKHYSDLVGPSGNVLIFVSKPSAKSQRTTPDGKVISPEVAKKILEIYCKNLPNVSVEITPVSPVKSCYDIGERLDSGVLIFGCSKKDDDIKRFKQIKSYIESRNPSLIVMDPQTTAVDALASDDGVVSATNFRKSLNDLDKIKEFLPDHLNDNMIEEIFKLLN